MNRLTEQQNEIWKPIKGYEKTYCVSNFGRVKSIERIVIGKNNYRYHKKEHILKQSIDRNTGYYYVNLFHSGKLKRCTVHRLVAQTFILNPDNLYCVNHKDENRLNNCVDNLEWLTNYDNLVYSDAWKKGVKNRRDYNGINNPFYGKTHSEYVRKKLSTCKKGKIRITDGTISKIVSVQEFETNYKNLGWKRGMIKHYDNK